MQNVTTSIPEQTEKAPARRRRGWIIVLALIIVAVLIWATTFRRSQSQSRQGGTAGAAQGRNFANMPIPVVAVPAATRDLPVYLRGLGSVTAYNTVTVRTRVDGELVKVNFREGQEVKAGDLLVVVDPRPFEVMLHQAQANLAKDEATLRDAQVNLGRFQALYAAQVIAKQQLDTQASLVGQLEGAIGADKAAIENAKLQLVYCRITAPIPGRVGLRLVDPGNIVHANDQNGLLVITQLQPIAVIFTLPEDSIPAVLNQARKGTLQVDAYTRDDTTKIASGKLLTINNLIDPTTGTDRLKGVFENPERVLWPNQFVNIHLLLDVQKNATVIPAAGVQRGSQGTFVYVVKPDKTVEVRPIKVGVTEGNVVSIAQGLAPGDLVVTDGQDKLQPGSKVEVRPGGASGAASGTQPPATQPQQPAARSAAGSS